MMTTSSVSILMRRLSPVAMRERADIGSPCEPVEITQISPGGSFSMSSMSTSMPSGKVRSPMEWASSMFLAIERPMVATCRPLATAASTICWIRWMWLAKQATMRRLPGRAMNSRRMVWPTVLSDSVNPGSSALVESESRSRMPGPEASAPMWARSVRRPSTGSRSILKSPECITIPWGVWKAMAMAWGTEWVTGMNSTSQGPIRRRSPSATATKLARSERPASSTRLRASPSVSAEP